MPGSAAFKLASSVISRVTFPGNATMRAWIGVLAAAVCLGCGSSGPQRFSIGGTITFDGSPVPDGEILLTPDAATGGPTVAGHIENGEYFIPEKRGPLAGKYKVAISAERKTGRKVSANMIGNETTDQYEQYLPPRYNDQTTLTVSIDSDRDDLGFDLTSKP
jgi:hypothetical protein